jgi:tetratricopeptide (TPR) repeat protein
MSQDVVETDGLTEPDPDIIARIAELHRLHNEAWSQHDLERAYTAAKEEHELSRAIDFKKGIALGLLNMSRCLGEFAQYELAISYMEEAREYYREVGNEATILNNLSTIRRLMGDCSQAISLLREALTMVSEESDPQLFTMLQSNLGGAYLETGDYDNALRYCSTAVELTRNHRLPDLELSALKNLTTIFHTRSEHETARSFGYQVLALAEERGNIRIMGMMLVNLCGTLCELKEFGQALELGRRGLVINRDRGDRNLEAQSLHNIGRACKGMQQFDEARSCFEQSLHIFREVGARSQEFYPLHSIGEILSLQGDMQGGIAYCTEALKVAEEIDSPPQTEVAHRTLYQIFKEAGDMTNALRHFEIAVEMERTAINSATEKQLNELRVQHETEQSKKESELQRLRAEQLQQQLERKNAELAAQALSLARQAELLGAFRNDLRTIVRKSNDPAMGMKAVKEKLEELPCESIDWTKFEAEFQVAHPEFRNKLLERYPTLTKMEIKICSMLKLRLTSSDIATLFCLSDRSVESHRYNIRRKLGISSRENIHDLLAGI